MTIIVTTTTEATDATQRGRKEKGAQLFAAISPAVVVYMTTARTKASMAMTFAESAAGDNGKLGIRVQLREEVLG